VQRVCNLVAEVNNQNACTVGENKSPYILFGAAESRKKRWIATLANTSGAS